VIPGDPKRSRDFLYVDDLVPALEKIAADARWNEVFTIASGVSTPLLRAAELVRDAAGSSAPIETPGGDLPAGENESYAIDQEGPRLDFDARPLEEAVQLYVEWLSRHPAAKGRAPA
jgi:nucleoside-diphosphate-sugar epimerase